MADWYLAPALVVLRAEINTRWPGRDRTSDGSIGDAAHQASTSDHNPNSRGSVNAIDVDEDGVDFPIIFAAIKRHPSARYVIYERRLYHRLRGWVAEPYSGTNPHDHHFHLSIDQLREAEQDRRPWGLLEDDMDATQAGQLAEVHELLTRWRSGMPTMADGQRTIEPVGWRIRDEAWQGKVSAALSLLSGRDWTDEAAIVSGVLAGLDPAAIAAAIPADLAQRVADELAARLTS